MSAVPEISVEVGDTKQPTFFPQAKLIRWRNEVNLSVRFAHEDAAATVEEIDGRTVWRADKLDAQFYELEDGYEIAVTLYERPAANVLTFTVQTKGLDFFYQAPLANVEADGSSWQPNEGGGIARRPAYISGGYVAFRRGTNGDHTARGGQNYRHGRAFEIHRPWAEDANGARAWCDVAVDIDAGLLLITVPQKFLDSAAYPVFVDPTIGTSTVGASVDTIPEGKFAGFTAGAGSRTDSSGGALTALKLACNDPAGNKVKLALYPNGGGGTPPASNAIPTGPMVAGSSTGELTITRTTKPTLDAHWTSGVLSPPAIVAANTYYWPCAGLSNPAEETELYFDDGPTFSIQRADGVAYVDFPPASAPATFNVNDDRIYSIYGVYAAATVVLAITGQRNRPGRGPLSLGRFFIRERIDAFSRSGPSTIQGTASVTLTPVGVLRGSGRLTGSSALSVSPTGTARATGRLSGTSTLSMSPAGVARGSGRALGAIALVLTPAGTLHSGGTNSIAGSLSLILTGAADLNALGRLAGASSLTLTSAGILHASGRLSGAAALQLGLIGDLNALGRLLGSSTVTLTPTGTTRGNGRLAGNAALAINLAGAMQGLGSNALRGTIALALTPAATIRATGRLGGTIALTLTPAAAGRSLARLQGGVFLSISPAGDLNAFGRLAGTTGLTLTPTAHTDAAGTVRGTATLTLSPSGTLRGTGRLAGLAQLAITLLGILRDQGAQSVPNSVQTLLALLVNSEQQVVGEREPWQTT